jgi:phosphatidylinositol glycan class N
LGRYDWLLLRTIVAVGYLGSIVLGIDFCLRSYASSSTVPPAGSNTPNQISWGLALASFVAFSAKFFVEHSPPTYYLYALFPCFFWGRVLQHPGRLLNVVKRTDWLSVFGMAAALEAMVLGYFYRSAWTAGFVFLGCIWPFVGMERDFRERNKQLGGAWSVACLATSIFTLLPVEKGENLLVMYVPISANLCVCWGRSVSLKEYDPDDKCWRRLLFPRYGVIGLGSASSISADR